MIEPDQWTTDAHAIYQLEQQLTAAQKKLEAAEKLIFKLENTLIDVESGNGDPEYALKAIESYRAGGKNGKA